MTAQMCDREPQIRPAEPRDARELAALWATCAPESVWSRLGVRVGRVYFERFCSGDHEVGLTAWIDGGLAGACLGTDRPASYATAFYTEHRRELAGAFLRELISRPATARIVVARAARAMKRLRPTGGAAQYRPADMVPALGLDPNRTCYLTEIFVSPSARGRQLGSALIRSFCVEMALRGCESCFVHVTEDNLASQIAQQRAGFECVARHGPDLTFMRKLAAS